MTEFEKVLQECLHDLEQGTANMDECLRRHPAYAGALEPILFASESLGRASQARLSDAFKARVRAKLIQEMRAHPHKSAHSSLMFMRLSIGIAVIVLTLLVTGTAYAQSTLPGDALYNWKLASESAWRAVSSDPVETDLAITERRLDELVAVKDDPALRARTLEVYFETVTRLKSQAGTEDQFRVSQTLDSQIEKMKKLGIFLSQVDPATLPSDEPIPLTKTPLPTLQTPTIAVTSPQVTPTVQAPPKIVPTIEIPPKVNPTVEIPPELVPTFEIPPPIR